MVGHQLRICFNLFIYLFFHISPSCESSAPVKRLQGCLRPAGAMICEERIVHMCVCVRVMSGKTDREAWIDGRMCGLGPYCQICAMVCVCVCVENK